MNLQFHPYPPRAVRTGGEIRRRMELTADKILHRLDVDQIFVRHYRNRSEKPDVPGGFSGYGMFLDAVVKATAGGIGGEAMRRFKTARIAELIAAQSADGAITVFSGKPGFWDNHDQAYMIQALVLDHRYFGCADSLAAALRLGRFLTGRGTAVNLGLETAFLMLYRESADRSFLDFCRVEFKLTEPLDVYDRMTPVNGIAHVYTWIARVLARLQYAQLTGDPSPVLRAGAEELFRRVFGGFSSISGSCSGGVNWGEIWDASQTGLGKWGETCVSAYLLRCTAKMLEFEPDSRYGDLFERILHNAFFGAQSADGLRQRYFIPFNEPGEWYGHETYCCPNNLRRMMFELPGAIYFQTPDGVAVNLYTDSELKTPDVEIIQKTGYPESEPVELTVAAKSELILRLRIPSWCTGAELHAGGVVMHPGAGSWFPVSVPRGETGIRLILPMESRLVRGTMAQANRAALMRGPLVYAVECGCNGLSGHQMDLLAIDSARPPVPENGVIRVPCVIQNQAYPHKEILFTRFSGENRCRTYFPTVSPEGLSDDPLYSTPEGK